MLQNIFSRTFLYLNLIFKGKLIKTESIQRSELRTGASLITGITQVTNGGIYMKPEEAFLKSDFEQCFQHMRHYDSHFMAVINFIFAGFAAIAIAAISFLNSIADAPTALLGAALLFILMWVVGTLLLGFLLRNRIYFTSVARYINEIRGCYLALIPMGFKNETELPTTKDVPHVYNPWSTQTLLMYFVAVGNSLFLGAGAATIRTLSIVGDGKTEISLAIFFPVCIFGAVVELLWVILYLQSRDERSAVDIWFGKKGE